MIEVLQSLVAIVSLEKDNNTAPKCPMTRHTLTVP
jgi:hypothetical protein